MAERERDDRSAIDRRLAELAVEARDDLPTRVADAVAYALAGEGKRLRGQLVLLAYRACGGQGDADKLAAAVEVMHAYSLAHDDLPCMDDDDMRRGRPTLHRAWDPGTAAIAGVTMIPLAARALWAGARELGLEATVAQTLVRELCSAAGAEGMVGGQLRDLDAEGRAVGLEELSLIHRGKTGALIEASAVIGALAARATPDRVAALRNYAAAVGLAFQIADDILDVTSTTAELGKTAGKDVGTQKSTYPALLGIEGAREMAGDLVCDAVRGLEAAGVDSPDLVELARFTVARRR